MSKPILKTERLELRVTKADKAKLQALAKKTKRTVTSLVIEALEGLKL